MGALGEGEPEPERQEKRDSKTRASNKQSKRITSQLCDTFLCHVCVLEVISGGIGAVGPLRTVHWEREASPVDLTGSPALRGGDLTARGGWGQPE